MVRRAVVLLSAILCASIVHGEEPLKIIRANPNPPATAKWKAEGPNGRQHVIYQSTVHPETFLALWRGNSSYVGPMSTTQQSEICYLLEGSAVLSDKAGHQTTFKAGDLIMIPRGTTYEWKNVGNVKIYYALFDHGKKGAARPAGAGPTFYKVDPDGASAGGMKPDKTGQTTEAVFYQGADKSALGVWETKPLTTDEEERNRAVLLIFLKGEVTLSTPEGQSESFKAGDVALLPHGIKVHWKSGTLREFWLDFDMTP